MNAALVPLPPESAAHFKWVDDPRLRRVVAALEARGKDSVRFVGGCVRDSLFGIAPKDFDAATTLVPDDVVAALKAANIGVALTGVDHGTVTAIADHFPVEVTTLRADVSTDGRRASVAFTRDWRRDSTRRDFTINALYLTPARKLFDPAGGIADIAARRVRFIGAAEDRIREDYLRILRFFRFSARFADRFDETGLAAAAALKSGIAVLSAERIGDELSKLLALAAPEAALAAMTATGILSEIWKADPALETLARLKRLDPSAPAPLALAALFGAAGEGIDARLRVSNAAARRRREAVANAQLLLARPAEKSARALLYRMGAPAWRDACLLAEAIRLSESETPAPRDAVFEKLATLPDRWPPPASPFTGKAALARGVPEGPLIAATLKAAEARWIGEDFPDDRRAEEILSEEAARALLARK